MEKTPSPEILEQIKEKSTQWHSLRQEVKKVIVGQDYVVDRILIALLCNQHVLLEGLPGLAKTTLIKTVAQAIGVDFKRIQFTPDLLPADLIGTLIYNPKTQEFQTKKGPLFTNVILADEINRAPAKVQSALLEAMQEHQVTISETTFKLDEPFLVLATQNPIEQEGTYRLPEAQIDRFMFKLIVTYPSISEEKEVLKRAFEHNSIHQVLSKSEIHTTQSLIEQIYLDEKVIDYILQIVFATRNPQDFGLTDIKHLIEHGASPRATLAIYHAAKGHAFLRKRHFVTPDDVKAVLLDILRHRILLTYEAEAENITSDQVVQQILRTIPAP
jgi:MoxR-like ATPase